MAARKIRAKAQKIAAHLLEGRRRRSRMGDRPLQGQGQPAQAKTMKELALAAHS
jgi:hypothetical protein